MIIEILVPDLPESVSSATIAKWHKKTNETINRDEVIVDIETDKVVLEVAAPESGVLESILKKEGSVVFSKQLIAKLKPVNIINETDINQAEEISDIFQKKTLIENDTEVLNPSLRRLLSKHNLKPNVIEDKDITGKTTRKKIDSYLLDSNKLHSDKNSKNKQDSDFNMDNRYRRVPMTQLRKTIANRLLEAKNNTAMLTTFNEVNMKCIINLRKMYKEKFIESHGVHLGFMSFYVKSVVEALKCYPEINASINGEDIIYHNYFDVSIAVSTSRGLVTPVLKDCDMLSFSDIEKKIKKLASKASDAKLKIEDLVGGNFTITNGGVFGSLMSTPIINPPQSAILGIHKIQDRPMAVDGKVEVLPMMYVALSYDHRLIDGRESVGFLLKIKELLEEPVRLLLNI
ncbi:dihydrolipoyllysine-residue succinyltransferase component of 2-oxoglutarate dehydrogenase complex [Candidatus Photodesmus katoptron]|uniref:2-oxoglutarate dehydrogenase complex dihydrolipoyllysine-residue succinyltransferase n=1 Tax=Candidatus Photodesmus anomalopis TaxID=28176 RepID=UPI0004D61126|nr:2-oxoglutarate dehydrogenase complex dihydrolipoyllysine-residue succinyltransferase [Candidatus Photodesmus katoptron]KEY90618.1 dihydrolipoyllysine-residue succinyltransferase component of 2-oxoglutarate dehydrogenase complex [Candidatus Photodesmus katoptron]